jgi:Spy/CpxP family protein refolding chaperone
LALGSLELRSEQRADVEQIGRELDQTELPVERTKDDLMRSISDTLEGGAVDRAALTPKIDEFVAARLRERPALERALVKLHDVLDSQQRSQFVDALEAAVQGAMTPESASETPELGLSEQQRQQLGTLGAVQAGAPSEQPRILKVLEAFRGESFHPEAIAAEHDQANSAQQRAASMLNVIEGLTRILTPQQRAKLAGVIRAGVQCASAEVAPEAGGSATASEGVDAPTTESVTQEVRPGFGFGGGVGRPGFGMGFRPGMGMGFRPGMGMGFRPGFGMGFRPGTGVGFRPGMGFGAPGFLPGFHRGFFHGFQGGFFPGFHRGFFPGVPFSANRVFAPFVPFAPFARFSSSFSSSLDISLVIHAMTSSFAFF